MAGSCRGRLGGARIRQGLSERPSTTSIAAEFSLRCRTEGVGRLPDRVMSEGGMGRGIGPGVPLPGADPWSLSFAKAQQLQGCLGSVSLQ